MDRNIVGSLTNSYPFVKDGLCKKTISINVEGSTQHLISYYTIDDVQNQRLTVPSNLPEIASLSISPIFLNKINFRYPPVVDFGPDGIPRYVGESTESARTPGHLSSGNESYSSGMDARHEANLRENRGMALYSPTASSDPSMTDPHYRFPHQIGGSGVLASPTSYTPPTAASTRARRSSEANRKRSNSRFDPYGHASTPGSGTWTPQGYTSGLEINGASVGSGRRSFSGAQRSWTDFAGSSHVAQQDSSVFSVGQMMHADSQQGVSSAHFRAGLPSIGHLGQASGLPPHPFGLASPSASSFPTVPSQPSRNSFFADTLQIKPEFDAKSEPADMFHFNSTRFPRGSWDSNQPSQTITRSHQVPQPPATSQGLTAMSLYSQSNFYDRAAQSPPPPTSASHESRHSLASGVPSSAVRIEELLDGVHPPTASQIDAADASRSGDRYANDPGSAGLNGPRAPSGPSSPYTRSAQQAFGQGAGSPGLQPRSASDLRQQQHPSSFLANPYSHSQAYHVQSQQASSDYPSELEGQAQAGGLPAIKQESHWSSDPVAPEGGNYASDSRAHYTPRAEEGNVQSQEADESALEDEDAKDCRSGFERVMLSRPAP